MDFDWIDPPFDLANLPPKDIEESFEDPFALKFLPDSEGVDSRNARYFSLGKSLAGRGIFSVFWTDGKRYRIIAARNMSAEEEHFYQRKKSEEL
ncbi:BrnT family toxin [Phragmitibacter flavus]|uniref:BrnT family toxin n=1 Tax=Phragmitibacter flavus TaxID=2576071 RepID=A0A5R8KAJ8_9BACT|nr:BrnT family toxin [Phragmitibacter flavus]TLD68945.1 BrnT family toxin [Phragmitibacter flavus]